MSTIACLIPSTRAPHGQEWPADSNFSPVSASPTQSSKQKLTVFQLRRLFTWEVDLDLTKLLVLKSKQVKSFKQAQSLGDSSLSVTTRAQVEQSKQTGVNWV